MTGCDIGNGALQSCCDHKCLCPLPGALHDVKARGNCERGPVNLWKLLLHHAYITAAVLNSTGAVASSGGKAENRVEGIKFLSTLL